MNGVVVSCWVDMFLWLVNMLLVVIVMKFLLSSGRWCVNVFVLVIMLMLVVLLLSYFLILLFVFLSSIVDMFGCIFFNVLMVGMMNVSDMFGSDVIISFFLSLLCDRLNCWCSICVFCIMFWIYGYRCLLVVVSMIGCWLC